MSLEFTKNILKNNGDFLSKTLNNSTYLWCNKRVFSVLKVKIFQHNEDQQQMSYRSTISFLCVWSYFFGSCASFYIRGKTGETSHLQETHLTTSIPNLGERSCENNDDSAPDTNKIDL
jgi:hypothetical protein